MSDSIGKKFMQLTTPQHMPASPQSRSEPQPALEIPSSPGATLIQLPPPQELTLPAKDLRDAIEKRRSHRVYTPQALTQNELAGLLWLTQGVKKVTDRPATLRTIPSAGARHPFETYLLINNVEGLQKGLYRYLALTHSLECVNLAENLTTELMEACQHQQHVQTCAVFFIWVAVVERTTWRYPERGYRYLFLDAGHVCQNLYLAAEAMDCGVCAIGAYDDDRINRALGLDGETQFVVYGGTLGKQTH